MPHRRRRKNKSRFADAPTEEGQRAQREAAFAAIRALYVESLPLWRVCGPAYCRRHHICGGDSRACIERGWPQMPSRVQEKAVALVLNGGPRRLPPATRRERALRCYPPSNFTH
jgi:hypothetical protein